MNKKLIILTIYITALHILTAWFISYRLQDKLDNDIWVAKQELSNQIAESLGEW